MNTNKKGFISIEYIIVLGIVISASSFIFIAMTPQHAAPLNRALQGVVNIDRLP